MNGIVVQAAGYLTTVQDLGRPGHAAEGISASGAADSIALRVGNRLVGNDDGAAALEMTNVGGSFSFECDTVIALAGADAAARLRNLRVVPWQAYAVGAGETMTCSALRDGARAYLCVRGGIAVPLRYGSASTHLLTGLGGFEGRALIAGDRLAIGAPALHSPFASPVDPSTIPGYRRQEPFRVTEGPQALWFSKDVTATFHEATWRVTEACDRMGIRLDGPALRSADPRELLTEGVCLGAVQIPSGGLPIVLSVEHQTTGGYPKIANVIAADLARLGTLRPRDTIRFAPVTVADARAMIRQQEYALDALFV